MQHVWRYAFHQYVVKFLRLTAETLRLKLSGKKKMKLSKKTAQTHLIAKRKKVILENIKTNNSGEEDKPRVSLARENRPDTFSVADEVLRMLRKGKKRLFDMGKVSHSFQDYL